MSQKVVFLGTFVLSLLIFVLPSPGKELPVLAVVAFENHSNVYLPDVANMGLQYLESALLATGRFALADRLSIERSLTEIGFSSASGLVDPKYAIELGRMLGARYLAMGNVIDISTRTTEFRGYGITTRRSFVSVTLGLRVVDAERGTVFFTDQVTLSRESVPLEFAGVRTSDGGQATLQNLMAEGIKRLVGRFSQKIAQAAPQVSSPAKMVQVSIASIPSGADVEIGGIFYGNTPCELSLEEGKVLEITVSLAGYEPWVKKVLIRPGLAITATLREIPQKSPGKTRVDVEINLNPQ